MTICARNKARECTSCKLNTSWYDMIDLLTTIGLTPGGSSTVHIYIRTIHRTTQSTQTIHRTTQLTNWEKCGPYPILVSYTLAFALQLRKKHGKISVRVAKECQLARWKQNMILILREDKSVMSFAMGWLTKTLNSYDRQWCFSLRCHNQKDCYPPKWFTEIFSTWKANETWRWPLTSIRYHTPE